MKVALDGQSLTIEQIVAVARDGAKVELSSKGRKNIEKCRKFIEEMVEKEEPMYGVTTGIGEFARIQISKEMGEELQKRIVYSHAAGFGDHQPIEVVRAAMLIRANVLCKGYSGVRPVVPLTMIEMLNKGVTPVVYEKGSVGTSGDLSPQSHVAEVVMGEGKAYYNGKVMSGKNAMKKAGIEPVRLSYKEGLGIINGPQMMTGGAVLLYYDTLRLLKHSIIASAMTLDALRAVTKAYDNRLHKARGYPGQVTVAANLRKIYKGSKIMANKSGKVQDGYSLRCTPQVTGPVLDLMKWIRSQLEIEINAASDNPLFFPDDQEYLAGANFHGEAVGLVIDYLCIAITDLGNLSERHTNRMLNPILSGLPDFLVDGQGLNSGLMVAQYTAAALVSENKVLSHPASVDSISVSADQEDHVSMGPVAIRKYTEILKNMGGIIGIEMMCAAQAYEFQKPRTPGKGSSAAYRVIRKKVKPLKTDRPLYPDIENMYNLLNSYDIINAVEKEVGEIKLL